MPEISFNPEALSVTVDPEDSNVRRSPGNSAFQPVMFPGSGIQPLMEGLRFANIQCMPSVPDDPDEHVDR